MKTKWIALGFCAFAAIMIAAGSRISHRTTASKHVESQQVYQVNGVVQRLESDGKTIVIAHEDIPDFMPAMTMPFTVRDESLIHGIEPGDCVRFKLVVTKDDSWISSIARRSDLPRRVPIVQSNPVSGSPILGAEQIVPDFTLTNQDNRGFHLGDYRGKAVLITFIYSRCSLPNYCPLMSKNFSELQQRLAKDYAGKFHLITISFDPDYDTPAILKSYAEFFTKDETTWTFATGTKAQVASVGSQFGLTYLPEVGSFTHDLRTALIAPDGRLVHVWRSNVWTPYEVERMASEVLDPQSRTTRLASTHAASDSQLQPRD